MLHYKQFLLGGCFAPPLGISPRVPQVPDCFVGLANVLLALGLALELVSASGPPSWREGAAIARVGGARDYPPIV